MKNLFVTMATVAMTMTTNAAAQNYFGNLSANPYGAGSRHNKDSPNNPYGSGFTIMPC